MAAALASGDFDFAFLHVKAVDDAGHDKSPSLKVAQGACENPGIWSYQPPVRLSV